MSAPGGIILTLGHATWCDVQRWGDGRRWGRDYCGGCNCGVGGLAHPHVPSPVTTAAHARYPWVVCEKCGVVEHMTYLGYQDRDPGSVRLCFQCQNWHDKLARRDDPGFVVVRGMQYGFDAKQPIAGGRTDFLGHAGSRFEIQLFAGRRIATNNLWCGGDVPLIWRPLFPDNASFVSRHGKLVRIP